MLGQKLKFFNLNCLEIPLLTPEAMESRHPRLWARDFNTNEFLVKKNLVLDSMAVFCLPDKVEIPGEDRVIVHEIRNQTGVG